MLRHLYGDVYYWTERHGRPETTYDWNSYAVRVTSANVLALVDPLPLTDAEIRQIEDGRPETTYDWNSYAVRVTSANVLALVDPLPLTDAEIRHRYADSHPLDL